MSDVKKGTEIEGSRGADAGPPPSAVSPQTAAAGGRRAELVLTLTECPWCGHIGRSIIDTNRYYWYECGQLLAARFAPKGETVSGPTKPAGGSQARIGPR